MAKGGKSEDLLGKKCLCNALLSNIGLAQIRKNGYVENPLVTSGDGIQTIGRFLGTRQSYKTKEAIAWLLS